MQLGPYTLQNYALFQDCNDDEVLRFLTCVMPREAHWSKGAVLHQQDYPLTDILLLLDGRLALTRIGASGQEVRAGDLESGALYGQATAFSDDQLEGFSITALTRGDHPGLPCQGLLPAVRQHLQRSPEGHPQYDSGPGPPGQGLDQ